VRDWDKRWIDAVKEVALCSKDRSRKVGAVIVNDRNRRISEGWNGFPSGVDDDVLERHQRPLKYHYTVHAEANAIYNSAAEGHATRGCRIYQELYPCSGCAGAIIQAGIVEIITFEPDWNDVTYAEDFAISKIKLKEAGVVVRFIEGTPPPRKDSLE